MHEPLSQRLAQILASDARPEGITLNELLLRTEGKGLYLAIMLLCVPFVLPVSVPGMSTVLGSTITLLSLTLITGRPARLPKFLGDQRLSPTFQQRLLSGGVSFLRLVEKLVRPRHTRWMASRAAVSAHALLLAVLGLMLAAPFPPMPPLTNTLPSYSIILVAASMMEEDGVTIWIAYAVSLGTTIYLVAIVELLKTVLEHAYQVVRQWLQQ